MSALSSIDFKGMLKSKTLIGLVMAAVPTIASWAGYTVTPADASEIVTHLTQYGEFALEAGGWALAFWGRLVATKKLVK